jgi:hypothetical protein
MPYNPELGQLVSGQPWQPYDADELTTATVGFLAALWLHLRPNFDSPFNNSGARFDYALLNVHAYSWGDEDQPWNLAWRDWRVSWYKYAGRGMSQNRALTVPEAFDLLDDARRAFALPPAFT